MSGARAVLLAQVLIGAGSRREKGSFFDASRNTYEFMPQQIEPQASLGRRQVALYSDNARSAAWTDALVLPRSSAGTEQVGVETVNSCSRFAERYVPVQWATTHGMAFAGNLMSQPIEIGAVIQRSFDRYVNTFQMHRRN